MNVRVLCLLIACYLLIFTQNISAESLHLSDVRIDIYFSPKGGAQAAIMDAIDSAQKEIKIMAYSFTAIPIANALVVAHRRGVLVQAILDKSQIKARYSKVQHLINAGISVYIDKAHAIAHNKVIIIDGHTVITGSYNFSKAAEERNAENLLIIRNVRLAQKFLSNFILHKEHSLFARFQRYP